VNNNTTTINSRSTTTVNVRPKDGNRGLRPGPGINGRWPVVINAGPRVLPGLVGETVAVGGLLPPVVTVPVGTATVDMAQAAVPVYIPQPVAAVPPEPVAVTTVAANTEARLMPTQPVTAGVQTARYLRIKNNTGEGLRVYVQHYSQMATGEWAWLPADPKSSARGDEYRVAPGTDAVLATTTGALAAQSVRLWAVSDSGREWADFKGADLTLVPEQDAAGNRYYLGETVGTFTLNFDA
jgi:hypothetical protein